MRTLGLSVAAAVLGGAAMVAGCAADSPSGTVLCTAAKVYHCDRAESCVAVSGAEVGVAERFAVDFRERVLTRARGEAGDVKSPIENLAGLGHLLFAQGIEDGVEGRVDGAGWSLSVNNDDGVMVASGVLDQAAIVMTGTCVPMAEG